MTMKAYFSFHIQNTLMDRRNHYDMIFNSRVFQICENGLPTTSSRPNIVRPYSDLTDDERQLVDNMIDRINRYHLYREFAPNHQHSINFNDEFKQNLKIRLNRIEVDTIQEDGLVSYSFSFSWDVYDDGTDIWYHLFNVERLRMTTNPTVITFIVRNKYTPGYIRGNIRCQIRLSS